MTAERIIIEAMFRIPDKNGKDVDFKLNGTQARLDDGLTNRSVIPKARQEGVSSYFVARWLAKCLAYRNRRCAIVSHQASATQKLLERAHYMIKHIKGPAPSLKYQSRNEIFFEKMDSALYIGTAGSSDFGVGDTITDLHGSEVALWPDPQALLKGLFQAVPPNGEIHLESTGKGMGNFYHKLCMRAAEGQSRFKLHFVPWTDAPEYRNALTLERRELLLAALDPDLEEVALFESGLVDLEQISWRREKLEELNYDLKAFKEQYPLTLDECFQSSGSSFFTKIQYVKTGLWRLHPEIEGLWVLGDHPRVGMSYAAGLDVGGGTERDNSVAEIFCLDTMEQVGEWASNRFEPHIFAQKVAPILLAFNRAYTNLERNNYGILTAKELLECYPHSRLHMSRPPEKEIKEFGRLADYGTFTSARNRLQIIGNFRADVGEALTIHSPLLKSEMDSFAEQSTGKVEANSGCFDDRVMAGAMASWVFSRAMGRTGMLARRRADELARDPFSLDAILAELEGKFNHEKD